MSFGAWFQQFQSNETIALSQYGQATFTSLAQFLGGTVNTFLYDPTPTEMNWRSVFGAFHAEDVIRLSPQAHAITGSSATECFDRLERSSRPRRQLQLHRRSHFHPAQRRERAVHPKPAQSFCRSRASA